MKKTLILTALVAASALNAQSFVAGWDFDDVAATAPSMIANWGDLAGSADLVWSHSPSSGPPIFTPSEFAIDFGFNSDIVGNTFAFVDPNTGYDQFSDGAPGAEAGFQSLSDTDSLTFSFDASGYTGLSLSFALDTGSGFTSQVIDLSAFDGNANAAFVLATANEAVYDNFAITGTAVPEPSSYAAIFGVIAIAFTATRRRRK